MVVCGRVLCEDLSCATDSAGVSLGDAVNRESRGSPMREWQRGPGDSSLQG